MVQHTDCAAFDIDRAPLTGGAGEAFADDGLSARSPVDETGTFNGEDSKLPGRPWKWVSKRKTLARTSWTMIATTPTRDPVQRARASNRGIVWSAMWAHASYRLRSTASLPSNLQQTTHPIRLLAQIGTA